MSALGMVETKGLIGAVEAADAMLKTADVRLLEKNLAGGGLVTITVCGEVAAVQAAVEGAVAAVRRISGACVFSAHVIPRPVAELGDVITLTPPPVPGAPAAPSAKVSSTVQTAVVAAPAPTISPAPAAQATAAPVQSGGMQAAPAAGKKEEAAPKPAQPKPAAPAKPAPKGKRKGAKK